MPDTAPAPGKKKAKLTPTMTIVILGVALAAGAFLLWRRRSAANAASTAGTSTPQPNNEDVTGQIATLQGEIGDLQSSAAQDEAAETGTGTTGSGTGTGGGVSSVLPAPAGLSVTPHAGGADAGWGTVSGATVYELRIQGAGGSGTGTSHYDHVAAANHARVNLTPGKYVAAVRAGKSTVDVHGHWTPNRAFTVPKAGKVTAAPRTPATQAAGPTGGGS